MAIETLIGTQNADGGWPYVRGRSWTEPTVYAVLALAGAGETGPAVRGIRWLRAAQRPDGGWPPQVGVAHSTWVTALAALVDPEMLGEPAHGRAIEWLLGMTGAETRLGYRIREWLVGVGRPDDQIYGGWPWFPGTAAWVGPTSLAILALEREHKRRPRAELAERIGEGRKFLLIRMCAEGGWNHGSAHPLGYDARPYPETTGMALAALRGVRGEAVDRALKTARRFLSQCRSADAANWLRLGLLAHGEAVAGYCPPWELACRTVPEKSLDLLVARAEKGGTPFWA
jgi:hypothetical protein